jgi:hypothetical protein
LILIKITPRAALLVMLGKSCGAALAAALRQARATGKRQKLISFFVVFFNFRRIIQNKNLLWDNLYFVGKRGRAIAICNSNLFSNN